MKKELDWKAQLDGCAQQMEIDPEKKEKALCRIFRAAAQKEVNYRPGWIEMIKLQFSSLTTGAWCLQMIFLLSLFAIERFLRTKTQMDGRGIFPALSVCMVLGAVVGVNELSRHFSYKVAEIEQSCYLNLSQLWLMRTCILNGLDVLAAILFGIMRAQDYGFGWFSFSVYVLTPFFVANAGLLVLVTAGRERGRGRWFPAAVLAGAGLWVQAFCPHIYEKMWLPVWIFILTVSILVCMGQMRIIGKKMEGEGLCWN